MPEITIRIALGVLAIVFAWAAVSKILRPRRWTELLVGYELPRPLAVVARVLVPVIEIGIAIAIVAGAGKVAAAASALLLGTFSIAVVRLRAIKGDDVPCGCFGNTRERRYTTLLARNAALAALAAIVLVADADVDLFTGIRAPRGGELLPALLVAIGIGLIAWMAFRTLAIQRRPAPRAPGSSAPRGRDSSFFSSSVAHSATTDE